jgi:hypothetical protein
MVQAQFRALREENVGRFSELADHRQEIQNELEAHGQDLGGMEPLDEEERDLLDAVQDDLRKAVRVDEEIRSILLRMRGQVAGQLKSVNRREDSVKEYLARDGQGTQEEVPRLNIRF